MRERVPAPTRRSGPGSRVALAQGWTASSPTPICSTSALDHSEPGSAPEPQQDVRVSRPRIAILAGSVRVERCRAAPGFGYVAGRPNDAQEWPQPYTGRVDLPVPEPPLTDGVVTLRSPDESDLPAIEQGIVDRDVVRWIGPSEHSAHQTFELNRSRWAEGTGATFSICDPADNCVGHVWVNLAGSGRGEVGYWLLPEARGKGLATRSVRLISRWALRELRLSRLSLLTEPSNEQSQRVAERSGFVREGVLRAYKEIAGRRIDCVVFSMLPSELGGTRGGRIDPPVRGRLSRLGDDLEQGHT